MGVLGITHILEILGLGHTPRSSFKKFHPYEALVLDLTRVYSTKDNKAREGRKREESYDYYMT